MTIPVHTPIRKQLTPQEHKKRARQWITKHKPAAPAPTPLTNSDVKGAIKGWIDNQWKEWLRRVIATQDAIHMADSMYQNIMSQKASTPILDSLLEKAIIGIAMATLPELSGAALIFEQIVKEHELRKKAAELIAHVTKEAAAEIQKSLAEYKSGEEKSNAQSIGVEYFQKLYARVGVMRDRATYVNEKLTHYIDVSISSNDPMLEPKLNEVLGIWYDAGLQIEEIRGIDSKQLALVFVYDLMRTYCWQHVRLGMKAGIVNMSWELKGLDTAQQSKMFETFRHIEWHDPLRPQIQSFDDVINKWAIHRASDD
jgi:hypothetical protein